MQAKLRTGTHSASQKYDVITALGCHALAGDRGSQRLVLRFVTLLTARYNWRLDLLSSGQREIAALWSVDERTVKREMAKLRTFGWLILVTPARRGRVAAYRIDLAAIHASTRPSWDRIGSDFCGRLDGEGAPEPQSATVLRFPSASPPQPAGESDTGCPWTRARALLQQADPLAYAHWFEALAGTMASQDHLRLHAPSAFHATYVRNRYMTVLEQALRQAGPGAVHIEITA